MTYRALLPLPIKDRNSKTSKIFLLHRPSRFFHTWMSTKDRVPPQRRDPRPGVSLLLMLLQVIQGKLQYFVSRQTFLFCHFNIVSKDRLHGLYPVFTLSL